MARGEFVGSDAARAKAPVGQTKIHGRGTYRIRFSNVDAEVRLWVNEQRIAFDGATTYVPRDKLRPVTTAGDPGDLAPVGIGTRDAALHIQRLRVLRDVYYVATEGAVAHEYNVPYGPQKIREILQDPASWPETDLVRLAGSVRDHDGGRPTVSLGRQQPTELGCPDVAQALCPTRPVDRQGLVDLLASSLVSPHPVLAQLQTDAV